MTRRPGSWPWHPLLLALYPVLLLSTRNADAVPLAAIGGPLVVVLAATALALLILVRLQVGVERAALLTSAILFVVFAFDRNVYALQSRRVGGTQGAREAIILAAELLALAGWGALLRWRSGLVPALHAAANAGSLVLLGSLVPALVGALGAKEPRPAPAPPVVAARPAPGGPKRRDPDIYWIVLDAYGRSDALRSFVGWDNRAFLGRMVARGFTLLDRSAANYCQTALSISATLAGEYHDDLAGSDSKSRLPLFERLGNNATLDLLRARGYELAGFASGFGLTDSFPSNRRLAPPGNLSEFGGLLLDTTPWATLTGRGAGLLAHHRHRARILFALDHLPEVAGGERPTFTLAHLVAPHPPFVFARDGGDRSADTATFRLTDGLLWSGLEGHGGPDDYARRYRDQAGYLGDRIEALVDQILNRSGVPPVIVIQGDHGPGSHFDTDSPRPNDLAERMGMLNLILLPGGSDRLDPALTPVNTFRVIGDHVFGTTRGTLPDRNYYSSYQAPYRFIDVTAEVRKISASP